ncbi:MAG TPA: 6-bladed beta-propeller [Bacteroidales bacterium]|nr:6-bladed beta-propeller [Bacteroidales bacterium]
MKPNLFFLLYLLVMISSCKNPTPPTPKEHGFFTVDFEKALSNEKLIKLSEIAKSVKYIPLQTDSTCLLPGSTDFMFTNDYILYPGRDEILEFDYTGKFIRKIGTPGKGPNEINMMMSASVLNNENLVAVKTLGNNKMIYFDLNGRFVKSVDARMVFGYAFQNDTMLAYDLCSMGYEDYFFRLTNSKNDTISVVQNPYKWTNNTGTYTMMTFDGFNPFYWYKNRCYFKCMHNDTVYTITKGKIVPSYLINLGKYQLPIEKRPENPASMAEFENIKDQYYYACSIENQGKVFVSSFRFGGENQQNILYDIEKNTGEYLVNDSSNASGFINDWDGGPDFWPQGNVNDNTLFMAIPAVKLKALVESDAFLNATGNDKNRKALIDLAAKVKEEDNPVLMLVEL